MTPFNSDGLPSQPRDFQAFGPQAFEMMSWPSEALSCLADISEINSKQVEIKDGKSPVSSFLKESVRDRRVDSAILVTSRKLQPFRLVSYYI